MGFHFLLRRGETYRVNFKLILKGINGSNHTGSIVQSSICNNQYGFHGNAPLVNKLTAFERIIFANISFAGFFLPLLRPTFASEFQKGCV